MDIAEIQQAIEAAVPDAQVMLEGEGCNFSAAVVSDNFQGVPLVKRQQQVLAAVAPWIATGALHAFTVKAHTKAEWHSRQTAAGMSLGHKPLP